MDDTTQPAPVCPVFVAALKASDRTFGSSDTMCIGRQCAWWIKTVDGKGMCAVASIASNMPDH